MSNDHIKDVWGIHNLIHPNMGEPVFLEWYGSDIMVGACSELLHVSPDNLQLELVNMLVNPIVTKSFSLPWHRDLVASTCTTDEEINALAEGLSF